MAISSSQSSTGAVIEIAYGPRALSEITCYVPLQMIDDIGIVSSRLEHFIVNEDLIRRYEDMVLYRHMTNGEISYKIEIIDNSLCECFTVLQEWYEGEDMIEATYDPDMLLNVSHLLLCHSLHAFVESRHEITGNADCEIMTSTGVFCALEEALQSEDGASDEEMIENELFAPGTSTDQCHGLKSSDE